MEYYYSENHAFQALINKIPEITLPLTPAKEEEFRLVSRKKPAGKEFSEKFIIQPETSHLFAEERVEFFLGFKFRINPEMLGVVFLVREELSSYFHLLTYDRESSIRGSLPIHGEFGDSEYQLAGAISPDFSIHLEKTFPLHPAKPAIHLNYQIHESGIIIKI